MKYLHYLLILILLHVIGASHVYGQSAGNNIYLCSGESRALKISIPEASSVTYVWYRDGIEIQRDVIDSIVASEPGAYTVICINAAGCESDVSDPMTVAVKNLIAKDDMSNTKNSTPVTIPVISNDEKGCYEIDSASIVIIAQPDNGTVLTTDSGTVIYTPAPGFEGFDTFTYTIKDIAGNVSNVATVVIEVTSTPLYTNFLHFNAYKEDQSAKLEWATSFDDKMAYFEIERSSDAANFHKIGIVYADHSDIYHFRDQYTLKGYNYYRIRIIGHDESLLGLSEVRLLDFESLQQFEVYPNPTYDIVNIDSKDIILSKIEVISTSGQILDEIYPTGHLTQVSLEALPAGTYYLKCIDKEKSSIKIFKVQKL